MRVWPALARAAFQRCRSARTVLMTLAVSLTLGTSAAWAQPNEPGGEAALKLPDLSSVSFLGIDGHKLLMLGLIFCVLGLGFGLAIYMR